MVTVTLMLNEFNMDDIYIRHAIDEEPVPTSSVMHIHDRCEIYFFVSGNVEYLVEGSRYPLEENSLLIMRPAESHTAKILEGKSYERFAINFPTSYLSSFDTGHRLMKPFLERPLGKDNLFLESDLDMSLVKKLLVRMTEPKDVYEKTITIGTHLPLLLFMIYEAFSQREYSAHNPSTFSERAVQYINNHLFEEITVSRLAAHFNLSVSQFGRAFRKSIGSSPWEYILRKRLASAKEMLQKGAGTQEACVACGFSDYSAFYRAFKKYLHESPGESRLRQAAPVLLL